MSSFMQSQFAVSDRIIFDFKNPQLSSDSDEEQQFQQLGQQTKELKKAKKSLDLEIIKNELLKRPPLESDASPMKKSSRLLIKSLPEIIITTPTMLIEQLSNLKAIKLIKEHVPTEQMNAIYSQLRYQYVSQGDPIYKQGDQNTRFYILLEGKCVVMKPKEKMVGFKFIESEQQNNLYRKYESDPYQLKTTYPDYIILKILQSGDYFGEAAIKMGVCRSSTVIALENCHVLYLSDQAFVNLIDPYFSKTLDTKIQYFQQNPNFKNINYELNEIMGIVLECQMQTFKGLEIIYNEGNKSNHLYFIISGQVELSKSIGSKYQTLSSCGENQIFGEVEIFKKQNRFSRAKVISPRLVVYKIRKNKFFDNLGNAQIFDNLKKQSEVLYQYWINIYSQYQTNNKQKDEIFEAAQDQIANKPNYQQKVIVNQKLVEVQGPKLNQVKMLQQLQQSTITKLNINSKNKTVLQRVYSNALQQYQARLLKKPEYQQSKEDNCVRSTSEKKMDFQNTLQITDRYSVQSRKTQTFNKLPTLNSSPIPSKNLGQILDSISRFPPVSRDNLVLSLMQQYAFKSENPDKKAKQINKVIQASFRNLTKQPEQHEHIKTVPKTTARDTLIQQLKKIEQ